MTINLSDVNSAHFCAAPWVNIHVNFTGHVKPCCHGSQVGYDSVQQGAWTYTDPRHPTLTALKTQLLSDSEPAYCQGCHERAWYQEFLVPELSVNQVDDFKLKSIDVRWGTTCQLSCTYCDQWNSSTWGQLEHRANKTIPIQGRSYQDYYVPLFNFITEHQQQIQRVNLLGGEPLLLTENNQLLECINSDTHVEIFTNLNMDLNKNKIYQKLVSRNKVTWRISMENVADRFEFVRRGADWKQQVANLQQLSQDIAGTDSTMSLQSQFCVYSATRMPELYDFVSTVPDLTISWSTMLNNPACLNFFLYPESHKVQCLQDISDIQKHMADSDPGKYDLTGIMTQLQHSWQKLDPHIVTNCVKFHQTQQHKYFHDQKNFTDLWPEYSIS